MIILQFVFPSDINGHSGCFQVLAIMNKAAMNTPVENFFVEFLGQGVGIYFIL